MNTQNVFTKFKISTLAVSAAICLLMSSCGGGSSDSAVSAAPVVPPVSGVNAPPDAAPIVSPNPVPEPGTVPITPPAPTPGPLEPIPVPPDLSIGPAPGTVVEPMLPTVPGPDAGLLPEEPQAPPIVVSPPLPVELPAGAVLCQPSICPPYAINGSVTNGSGALNPTEAQGYLIMTNEPSVGDDQYPELGNLPRLVLQPEWVTIGEAPVVTDNK